MDLDAALAATASRTHRFAPEGVDEAVLAADRFRALFEDFTPAGMLERAPAAYADDAWFDDTLKHVRGNEAIAEYLAEGAAACNRAEVDVHEARGADGDYLVRWTMRLEFKKLARGRLTSSIGASLLRFDEDGRILLHQDYWDGATGFFQYVPVLGAGIRWIKGRL